MSLRRTEPVLLSSLVSAIYGVADVFSSRLFHQVLSVLLGCGELALAQVRCTGSMSLLSYDGSDDGLLLR